jgi:hypothetical protein
MPAFRDCTKNIILYKHRWSHAEDSKDDEEEEEEEEEESTKTTKAI